MLWWGAHVGWRHRERRCRGVGPGGEVVFEATVGGAGAGSSVELGKRE